MRLLTAIVLASLAMAPAAQAGQPTSAMIAATDRYAADYAAWQGWTFLRVLPSMRGDWRHGHFWLLFDATDRADSSPNVEFDMRVEAVAVRCGPHWYVVSTPLDRTGCVPAWRW